MKKALYIAISLLTISLLVKSPAYAAEECTTSTGSYGQTSTTCKVLGETTTVTHETVSAGVGDVSFWQIALALSMASVAIFGLSKLAERVYWFD